MMSRDVAGLRDAVRCIARRDRESLRHLVAALGRGTENGLRVERGHLGRHTCLVWRRGFVFPLWFVVASRLFAWGGGLESAPLLKRGAMVEAVIFRGQFGLKLLTVANKVL